MATPRSRPATEAERDEVLRHPVVQQTLDLFEGQVVNIEFEDTGPRQPRPAAEDADDVGDEDQPE